MALYSMRFQKVIKGSVRVIYPLFSFIAYSSECIKHQEQLLTRSKKPLKKLKIKSFLKGKKKKLTLPQMKVPSKSCRFFSPLHFTTVSDVLC